MRGACVSTTPCSVIITDMSLSDLLTSLCTVRAMFCVLLHSCRDLCAVYVLSTRLVKDSLCPITTEWCTD